MSFPLKTNRLMNFCKLSPSTQVIPIALPCNVTPRATVKNYFKKRQLMDFIRCSCQPAAVTSKNARHFLLFCHLFYISAKMQCTNFHITAMFRALNQISTYIPFQYLKSQMCSFIQFLNYCRDVQKCSYNFSLFSQTYTWLEV